MMPVFSIRARPARPQRSSETKAMSEQASRWQRPPQTDADESGGVGPIRACIDDAVRAYLRQLGDHECRDLHGLVLSEVEPPLLRAVLDHCQGNQTRAARLLGVNRATLRKKLLHYGISQS